MRRARAGGGKTCADASFGGENLFRFVVQFICRLPSQHGHGGFSGLFCSRTKAILPGQLVTKIS